MLEKGYIEPSDSPWASSIVLVTKKDSSTRFCIDYRRLSVAHKDRPKTAFTTRKGLLQWGVMPFGLLNAPATFSRLMELVLRGLSWEHCMVYLDDIIMFGHDFDQALENLDMLD